MLVFSKGRVYTDSSYAVGPAVAIGISQLLLLLLPWLSSNEDNLYQEEIQLINAFVVANYLHL